MNHIKYIEQNQIQHGMMQKNQFKMIFVKWVNIFLPHQIQLRVDKEIITKTEEPIPNTLVTYAEIKEEKEREKQEEKKPKINKEVYLLEDQEKITYTQHVRARKQVPQIVADNYTCKRCEKKGDIMSNNVLKNGNRNFDQIKGIVRLSKKHSLIKKRWKWFKSNHMEK